MAKESARKMVQFFMLPLRPYIVPFGFSGFKTSKLQNFKTSFVMEQNIH
jgi:hypothetical protein